MFDGQLGYNPIGGNRPCGGGGYLQFWGWSVPNPGDTGVSLDPKNFSYLEVAYWRKAVKIIAPVNWYSGSMGAITRRVVAVDWQVQARVWWDYIRPPDLVPGMYDNLAIKLVIGADSQWTGNPASDNRAHGFFNPNPDNILPSWPPGGAAQPRITNPPIEPCSEDGLGILPKYTGPMLFNVPPDGGIVTVAKGPPAYIPCYVAPSCIVESLESVVSSLGEDGEDGIVYADITINGNSLLWYLPDLDMEGLYTGYVNQLAAQGMLPSEP